MRLAGCSDNRASLRNAPFLTACLLFNQLARGDYAAFDQLAVVVPLYDSCKQVFDQVAPQRLSVLLMDRTATEVEARLANLEKYPVLVPHLPAAVCRTFAAYLEADWEGYNTHGYHALELLLGLQSKPKLLESIPRESLLAADAKLTDKVRFVHESTLLLRRLATGVEKKLD